MRDQQGQAKVTRVRSRADVASITGAPAGVAPWVPWEPRGPRALEGSMMSAPGFRGAWSADAAAGSLEQAEGAFGVDFGERA